MRYRVTGLRGTVIQDTRIQRYKVIGYVDPGYICLQDIYGYRDTGIQDTTIQRYKVVGYGEPGYMYV